MTDIKVDREFTFGSLFAGIGGIDLGLERAGMKCKWQVENGEYATEILKKRWPHVEKFGDVRRVSAGTLSSVDLVAGGFPCQDVSQANPYGRGLEGERSGLWFEFARIIEELRPGWILIENVPRLRTINNGRDFRIILKTLAKFGYDAEWEVISASSFGAPHRRKRIFIVAYSHSKRVERLFKNVDSGITGSWGWRGKEDLCFIAKNPFRESDRFPKPLLRRMDDGTSYRMDRLTVVGNSVVPDIAEFIGKLILEAEGIN